MKQTGNNYHETPGEEPRLGSLRNQGYTQISVAFGSGRIGCIRHRKMSAMGILQN